MTTADEALALGAARELVAAGVPVFLARPDAATSTGFALPKGWQHTQPDPSVVDSWRPGMALAAVMGHGLDLVDVDPRNGGDLAALNGTMPTVYALASTPSGGVHAFVASLGVRSRDNVLPGVDIKAGDRDGSGRGFAFIAPTVRTSKVTGAPARYSWQRPPRAADLTATAADVTGRRLAELVAQTRTQGSAAPGPAAAADLAALVANGVPPGEPQDVALSRIAWQLRAAGVSAAVAHGVWTAVAARTELTNPAHPWTAEDFARHWRGADTKIGADADAWAALGVDTSTVPLPAAAGAAPVAGDAYLEQLTQQELARLKARRAALERLTAEDDPNRNRPLDVALLAEVLARPREHAWRMEQLWPARGRMLISGPAKVGKTTLVAEIARALLEGGAFLERFATPPASGGRVVLVNAEMSDAQMAAWLHAAGVPVDGLALVNVRGHRNPFGDDTSRRELAAQIRSFEGHTLIVDTFAAVYTGESANDAGQVRGWLGRLDELAESAGCTELVLTAHSGHEGERVRGSSALLDWPDVVVQLTRDDAGGRYLHALGRDVDVTEDRLDYDEKTRRLTLSGAGSRTTVRAAVHLDDLVLALVDTVRTTPGLSVAELRTALRERGCSFSRNDVSAASQLAYERGLVKIEVGARGARKHHPAVAPGPDAPPVPTRIPDVLSTGDDPYRPVYIDGTGHSTRAAASRTAGECSRCHAPGDFGLVGVCLTCRGGTPLTGAGA